MNLVTTDDAIIELASESVRLELLPLGATLRRFEVLLPDGTWRNILLGHPTTTDYETNTGYLGATVGRFANRIGGARFSLDCTRYIVDDNEGPNLLHGGA